MVSDSFLLEQEEAPLLEALSNLLTRKRAAFHTPGHNQGEGIGSQLTRLLGNKVFLADLPELPELDNLFAPQSTIARAQDLAARCFGADQTWFLINGSSCGIISAIVATCRAGDKIILPRNIHQSAIAGLIVSGATPVFINPQFDTLRNITYSITPEALEQTLEKFPETKAVMILHPSYQGVCCDLEAIAKITHSYNIPLIVDEAHGGHFHFHDQLPPAALSVGADLTIQSTHKVLGAMTQASMMHLQGSRIDPQRISRALQLSESTSPSYILLASLDAARKQMALEGRDLMSKALALAEFARSELAEISSLKVLEFSPQAGFKYLDRTRLTIDIRALGITGYEADEILHYKLGVTCELPTLSHLTFIITFGNSQQDIDRLIEALKTLASSYSSGSNAAEGALNSTALVEANLPLNRSSSIELSPRNAYFADTEMIALVEAGDRLSGELVCPYPPGIPVLMPGEIITIGVINYLQKVLASGGVISGCSDSTLATIKVIRG